VDGETYAITAGVKIQKNVEYKSISIDLGYFADPVFTGQGINMYLLDYEQPRDYVLTATSNSTLDFVTDFDRVQAIQPKNIQVRVLSFGTQSGDLGEIRFSGTFREWDKSANGYVNRTLSDGLITFKMK
jgi:hypothetical protein